MQENISYKVTCVSPQCSCNFRSCSGVITCDLTLRDSSDVQSVISITVETLYQGGVFIL